MADEIFQPRTLATLSDATQVGPDPISHPDRMAGGAEFLEQRLARREAKRIAGVAGFVVFRRAYLVPPFRIHGMDVHDQAVEVAEHRVPLPFAGRIVAEDDLVAMLAQPRAPVAELGVDRSDVIGF